MLTLKRQKLDRRYVLNLENLTIQYFMVIYLKILLCDRPNGRSIATQISHLASKYKGPSSSIDYRERGSHAQGVYPTQDTSGIKTVMVTKEEKTDKNNSKRVVRHKK